VIAGDIIFYSGTKTRSDDPDFKDFAHLAGYVQSYPYGDPSKTWHHVAIAVSPTEAVGFSQATDGVANWSASMTVHAAAAPAGQTVSLLRPPDSGLAQKIVEASNDLITQNTTYAGRGLLAFAAAMQSRMFVDGVARQASMNFAIGAELVAGPEDGMHTCVSAVLAAVQSALGDQVLETTEPPAPTTAPASIQLTNDLEIHTPIAQLLEKVSPGVRPDASHKVVPEGQVAGGYMTAGEDEVPGPIRNTTDYLAGIAKLIQETYNGSNPNEITQQGTNVASTSGWLVSPAMLHDALLNIGFTPSE
jgi:hypothetical protein